MNFKRASIFRSCWIAALFCSFAAPPLFAQDAPQPPAPAAKTDPQTAARLYRQGNAAFDVKDYNKAIWLFRQAVARDRAKTEYQVALADAYYHRAAELQQQQEDGPAIRHYQAAYEIDKAQRPRNAASDLQAIGVTYHDLERYKEALTYFQQALALHRKIKDREGESETLRQLGKLYRSQKQYTQSLFYFNQALVISRQLKNRTKEADVLEGISITYAAQALYKQELLYLQKALTIYREIKDRNNESRLVGDIGKTFFNQKRYQEALHQLLQSLRLCQTTGNREGEAWALQWIALTYFEENEHKKAIKYFEQAIPIWRELKNREREAAMLLGIGNSFTLLRQYEDAILYEKQSLEVWRTLKPKTEEAQVLGSIASNYNQLDQREEARAYLLQSLSIYRELGDRSKEASSLNEIGGTYTDTGQYGRAIEYHEQALMIYRQLKNRDEEVSTLSQIGSVYRNLSFYEEALKREEEALLFARESKNVESEIGALEGAALSLIDLGRPVEALGYLQQALQLLRGGDFKSSLDTVRKWQQDALEVALLQHIGLAQSELGQYELALQSYQQAMFSGVLSPLDEAYVLANIGTTYFKTGKFEQALQHYHKAMPIMRRAGDRWAESRALESITVAYNAQNQPALAIFYGKQAVNVYQTIRSDMKGLEKKLQQGYLKSNENIYRQLANLLIEQGRLPEAQQVLEMLKEEEFFDFVRRDVKAAPTDSRAALNNVEAEWQKRYTQIADKITAIGAEYGRLDVARPSTPEAKNARKTRLLELQSDLDVSKKAFDLFFAEVKDAFAKRGEASTQVLNLPETTAMQETLRRLDRKAVVLYTIVGEDDLNVMLLTADALVARKNPQPVSRTEVRRLVNAFLTALKNPRLDPRPAGQALYKVLFCDGQITKDLENLQGEGESTPVLMWSLDDVLRYVPMSALWSGREYLVERYAQSVFTLGSRDGLRDKPQEKWTALGLGVSKEHPSFNALPGVLGELRAVISDTQDKQSSGPLGGEILLDEKFTAQSLESGLLDHPALVHIASHFQFKPGTEADSFLLLGDGSPLTLDKIRNLRFSGVDLLTLSACDTATSGVDANGKEIEGFGVLAQRSGAGAVLASLWPVSDASTSRLMRSFYADREVGGGQSKAEALRQAQLALLHGNHTASSDDKRGVRVTKPAAADLDGATPNFVKDPNAEYSHPYYWAPFILIGNWR